MIDTTVIVEINGVRAMDFSVHQANLFSSRTLDSLRLAKPTLRPGLRSLRGPSYPTLTNKQIKVADKEATTLINATDPAGDDKGTGAFTYPSNANFGKGAFDLVGFKVSYDKQNIFFNLKFSALSNPGWHPEYGFQLTYIAIALDLDGIKNSGNRLPGHNSDYTLDEPHAFERLILVGGGVRVEENTGKTLVAYIPVPNDVSNPLGNSENGTIDFALPISHFGSPSKLWTFTVLVGAQDDHGGAGIGEFRTVNKERGEWNGGGKTDPTSPNVYDVLVAQPK
jgi:carbohydrate-binding DOMON domain-containing protein